MSDQPGVGVGPAVMPFIRRPVRYKINENKSKNVIAF